MVRIYNHQNAQKPQPPFEASRPGGGVPVFSPQQPTASETTAVIKVLIGTILAVFVSVAPVSAQTCAVPSNLTNGTTADATQVMANFTAVVNCINNLTLNTLRGYLAGLTMSYDQTYSTYIDTSAGMAESSDVTTMMPLAAWTKNANQAWQQGSGNGCLDSGSTLIANTWYHLFVIANPTNNTVDELCSQSATSPTLPTGSGYTKMRRIGSFLTSASSEINMFVQNGDRFDWLVPTADVNNVPSTGLAQTATLTVPSGVVVEAILSGIIRDGTNAGDVLYVSSIAQTDKQPSASFITAQNPSTSANGTFAGLQVVTNMNGQVRYRADETTAALYINTIGWIDTRGRFQ